MATTKGDLDRRLDALTVEVAELKTDLIDLLDALRSHLETCPGAAVAVNEGEGCGMDQVDPEVPPAD